MTTFPDIATLLPQQPPFICIDRLTSCDGETATTEFTIPADHLFCRSGRYSEAGLVETVAQSCAARIGYLNLQNNETVKLGIIGAIRRFEVRSLPAAGTLLTTRITVKSEVFRITLVDAEVYADGQICASCEMKISLTDIEKKAS
ncbi:MAG: hypothetical protein IJL64_03825 [Bacteroidales bacterium]|nr:hypothetical protein [Bacteroidales bacterium]